MARAAGRVTLRAVDRYAAPFSAGSRELRPSAAAAAALCGASARAEDCGHGPEGFSQWLNSFKQVAQGNGVSASAADAALDGVSYDPAVKRHDGGVAMFGHNFAGFAASHVTPGMVARGKAELKRYAEPLATIEQRFGVPGPVLVAIWGQETSFGGDSGSFPTYSALATLAWDCRRAERYRAELVDALMLVERGIVQNPRELRGAWAGEIGQTQLMPSAYLMFATTPDGTRNAGPHSQFRRRARLDRRLPQGARLAAGPGLGRRRAELRRHPAMEFGRDLRQDSRAVRRPAGGAVGRGATPKP